jgi:chromosome partitioning protein
VNAVISGNALTDSNIFTAVIEITAVISVTGFNGMAAVTAVAAVNDVRAMAAVTATKAATAVAVVNDVTAVTAMTGAKVIRSVAAANGVTAFNDVSEVIGVNHVRSATAVTAVVSLPDVKTLTALIGLTAVTARRSFVPIIPFTSAKGGAGKSTACVILGTRLVARGYKVTILDADRNQPIARWHERAKSKVFDIVADVKTDSVIKEIDKAYRDSDMVLVDLEGSANMTASRAIARATMVIVPLGATQLDADEAFKSVGLVQDEEEVLGRKIPFTLLMTKCRFQPTIGEKNIRTDIEKLGLPIFRTRILNRVAYEAMFTFAATMDDFARLKTKDVSGVQEAIENADRWVDEVEIVLNDISGQGRAAA